MKPSIIKTIDTEQLTLAQRHNPAAHWKQIISELITDPADLCRLLELNTAQQKQIEKACADFPLRVPIPYLSRIKPAQINDPLLLQILPQARELMSSQHYSDDPLEESSFSPLQGLLHKYRNRVLIVLNGHCVIHCRYCFRRHFPYQQHRIDRTQWQKIIDYIAANDVIDEVILSGGDPLSCSDESLKQRIDELQSIPHLKRLRIHTRLPIMIPQRISDELLHILSTTRLHSVVVIHCNHAQEIDQDVQNALKKMHNAGIYLLNQSVLLKSINDCPKILAELSQRLFECQVQPYYLHLLDKVKGAQHFHLERQIAVNIYRQLQAQSSGYLVPKLVSEEAHAQHKTLII